MKVRFFLVMLVATVMVGAPSINAKDEKEFSATCPVSGAPAKKESSLAYKGRSVYFCCDNCPKAFKADTAKFATKANHQLASTGQLTQVACPFSGEACNPEATVDVAGVKVAFCCEKCQGKANAAEDKIACVFADISKGFTVQTECPVSGKAINIKHKVKHEDQDVYFCCDKCPAAFKADPKKFVEKLPQFAEVAEKK